MERDIIMPKREEIIIYQDPNKDKNCGPLPFWESTIGEAVLDYRYIKLEDKCF